jgi:hypothetical protein
MTLEHIREVGSFLRTLRRTIGDRPDVIVYFQVPEVARILHNGLFCDVPYEHCSYFSPISLAILFERSGFRALDTLTTYGEQHLAIVAQPDKPTEPNRGLAPLRRLVDGFAERCAEQVQTWTKRLEVAFENQEHVVLWGSGSKSTAFLTTLGVESEIDYVVDINPYRQGKYMAGTGQRIVAPDSLLSLSPDLVIIMNPIYREEIGNVLAGMGLSPKLLTL